MPKRNISNIKNRSPIKLKLMFWRSLRRKVEDISIQLHFFLHVRKKSDNETHVKKLRYFQNSWVKLFFLFCISPKMVPCHICILLTAMRTWNGNFVCTDDVTNRYYALALHYAGLLVHDSLTKFPNNWYAPQKSV